MNENLAAMSWHPQLVDKLRQLNLILALPSPRTNLPVYIVRIDRASNVRRDTVMGIVQAHCTVALLFRRRDAPP